jgi:hypothetical protein
MGNPNCSFMIIAVTFFLQPIAAGNCDIRTTYVNCDCKVEKHLFYYQWTIMIDDCVVIVEKKLKCLSRNTLCSADINNVCKQARQNIYRFASLICYVKKYITHIDLKLELVETWNGCCKREKNLTTLWVKLKTHYRVSHSKEW